jgi:hypothetical protein
MNKKTTKSLESQLAKAKINKVHAGWADFEIKFTSDIPCDPGDCAGYTNLSTYTIYVDPTLSYEVSRETLLHEIMHVLCEIIGYTDPDMEKEFNPTNEQLTNNMTRGLLLLAKLNPTLFKILLINEK